LGIVEPCPKFKGRYWKIFSLEEFGIEIPEIVSESKTIEEKTEQKPEDKEIGESDKNINAGQNTRNQVG
jgi:hypothetical protein